MITIVAVSYDDHRVLASVRDERIARSMVGAYRSSLPFEWWVLPVDLPTTPLEPQPVRDDRKVRAA